VFDAGFERRAGPFAQGPHSIVARPEMTRNQAMIRLAEK
jgi:hypothetical protein